MVIAQGDVYWLSLDDSRGSEPGYRHPCVVVQNNVFNQSRISTSIVCALTSNLKRAAAPGNVLLNSGEAGLPKPSVVNVTHVFTVDKSDLAEKLGTLSAGRVHQILAGLHLALDLRDVDDE